MTHLGLFEGIGGFSLAARWMGWETKAWCEWNEFGQRVLKHHFPEAKGYGDITKTDFTPYANRIDIITGGFPCQPYSLAGKRKGKEDERHLWPEMLRTIREVQPRYVVGENVFGLVNWNGGLVFDEVQTDLEAAGYEVFPYVLPACAVNAPHRRDRVWFVAHASSNGHQRRGFGEDRPTEAESERERNQRERVRSEFNGVSQQRNATDSKHEGLEGYHEWERRTEYRIDKGLQFGSENQFISSHADSGRQPCQEHGQAQSGRTAKTSLPNDWSNFPTQSPVCTGNDGLSAGLDGISFSKWRNESIKAGGNAIVPQVAYQIFKAIESYENL